MPGRTIEFVGMPGSGKSTISHAVAGLLRDRGNEVLEPTRIVDRLPSGRARRTRKLKLAVAECVRCPGRTIESAGAILRTSQASPAGHSLSILNWVYLAGLYRQAARQPGISLFDQGILQAIWSVAAGQRSLPEQASDSWADRAAAVLVPDAVAVFVDAADPVLRSRLAGRTDGMSRLDSAIVRSESAAAEAFRSGRIALTMVAEVARRLEHEGLLRVIRLDSGTRGIPSLAGEIAASLKPGE